MVNKTFGLLFYLKKPKNYQKGPLPIYMRLTIDGKRAELATKRVCDDPFKWNTSAGRMAGNKEAVRTLNAHLDILQGRLYETYKDFLQEGKVITAETITNKLQRAHHQHPLKKLKTLIQILRSLPLNYTGPVD